jgi:outer membrane biosynthesis protein TonB
MATKLDKKQIAKLGELGITAKSVEDAHKQLIKLLAENGVDGVDDETLAELMDMYEAFYDSDDSSEDEDLEEAAEDAEEEDEEAAEDDEDEVEEEDDEEEVEEDEEEDEDEEEAPKKAPAKKAAPKAPVKKAAPTKPAPKAPVKKAKASRAIGEYFSKDNDEHVEMLREPFLENDMFEGKIDDFKLLKLGFTAYKEGESAKRAVFSYDRLKIVDGAVVGDLFFNALKGRDEVEENVDLGDVDREFKNFNLNLLFIPKVSPEEVLQILESNDLLDKMCSRIGAADKKAVKAREKMEQKMAEKTKKVPAPTKKAAKPVEEDEDEVEEAPKKAPAPVKKAVKKAAKK